MSEPQCEVKGGLEEKCHPKCAKYFAEVEACKGRIEKKNHGDCTPQMFDYWNCVDKCVAPLLWKELK